MAAPAISGSSPWTFTTMSMSVMVARHFGDAIRAAGGLRIRHHDLPAEAPHLRRDLLVVRRDTHADGLRGPQAAS